MPLIGAAIAARCDAAYDRDMAAAVIRLLTLIALVLMPIGMAGAPAMAAPADHEMAAMNHCDEMPSDEPAPPAKMDCTAMCTALPAAEAPVLAPMLKPVAPRSIAISAPASGIEPEIATPPPRPV